MPLTAATPANPSTLVLDPARLRAHLPRLTRIAVRLTGSPDVPFLRIAMVWTSVDGISRRYRHYAKRDTSCSVGSRPSGVR